MSKTILYLKECRKLSMSSIHLDKTTDKNLCKFSKSRKSTEHLNRSLTREKCPNAEFFLVRTFLYSVQIQENTN